MTLRRWQYALALLGILGLTVLSPSSLRVQAAEGTDGCDTTRPVSLDGTGHFPYYRWDGWVYDGGATQIGGATASLNTYSPWVPVSPNDNVSGWSMLGDGNPWEYAQVGYFEAPGNTSGGTARRFILYTNGPNTNHVQSSVVIDYVLPGQSYAHPQLESRHSYTTLWGYYGGDYSGLIDNNTIVDQNGNPLTFNPGFNATQAFVSGETHSANAQMLGSALNPLDMQSTGWVVKGSQSWQAFNATGTAQVVNNGMYNPPVSWYPYTSMPANPPWYGYKIIGNNRFQIWDIGCPVSVSSGYLIPDYSVFDSAGTGVQKTLTSYTPNLTNGPYTLTDQTATGNLVLSDARGYTLWSPVVPAAANYFDMQHDNNLVLYDGHGNGTLWQAGTNGHGYTSPATELQNNGNLVLYGDVTNGATALWSSNTDWDSTNSGLLYGQSLQYVHQINSHTNGYHLNLNSDCAVVLYTSGNTQLWNSGTSGSNGTQCHLDMQNDGNLVLYKYTGANTPLWNSGTNGTGGQNHMVVESNGHFRVYDVTGAVKYTRP